MDLRQSDIWGNYLSQIGWQTKKIDGRQILIRKVPLLPYSLIKIQRPTNPLPFIKIDRLAKEYRALFVIIEPEIDGYDETDFTQHGFEESSLFLLHTATIRLDLTQPLDSLWSRFSENARRNIKKAQLKNIKIKTVFLDNKNQYKNFSKFLELLKNLTRIKNFYVPTEDEYYKKLSAFKSTSVLLFTYQQTTSQPIAAVWLGFFDQTLYYMQTGITEEGYLSFSNYLLVWEALKLGKKEKLKIFDFEGIYDPRFPKERRSWEKFSEFKKRFHGQIIEFPPPWIKCYNPLFKLIYLCSKILPG